MPVMEEQVVGTVYTYNGVPVTIGRTVSYQQMDALPAGSVINTNPDRHQVTRLLVKQVDGTWKDDSDERTYRTRALADNYNVLFGVPEGVLDRQETIDEYKARFRAKVLSAAEIHLGRNDRTVHEVLAKLGVMDSMTEGSKISPNVDVPDGTVIMAADPGDPAYHVWERKGGRWVLEYGTDYDQPAEYGETTVIEVPEGVVRTEPNDSDAEAIKMFKAAAWDEGWKVKRNRGWCGAYEQILADVGLTYSDALPDFLGFEETTLWRQLPQGAVLVYQGAARWDMAVRDDNAEFGLRRIAGTSTGRLGRNRWRVFWNGEGNMEVPVNARVFTHLPAGSSFNYYRTIYIRGEDGRWRDTAGRHNYTDGDFGSVDVIVVSVG